MGLLRILLATSVMLEHAHGLGGYQMIGGALAVQCFFIVSGFYMGLVLNERYDQPSLNRTFWLNRALRIYGVYFFFLIVSLLVFALIQRDSGSSPLFPFLQGELPLWQKAALGLLNLTVIGQDLPVWLTISDAGGLAWTTKFVPQGGSDVFHFMLIPVAWSLSLELMFYAIAPFIARRPAHQIVVIVGVSLFIRIAAAWFGLRGDPFSYRFFPFELALFLAGVLSYRAWAADRSFWERPAMRWLSAAALLAIVTGALWAGNPIPDDFFVPQRIALLLLVALALPALHGLTRHSERDRAIGEMSYPFYLGHLLVLGLVGGAPLLSVHPIMTVVISVTLTLVVSWLVVRVVEPPIEALRRRTARQAGAA